MSTLSQPVVCTTHVPPRQAPPLSGERAAPESELQVTLRPFRKGRTRLNDPTLARIAQANPEVAKRVARILPELHASQDRLMRWLRASPQNTRAFIEDPINAFERATGATNALMTEIRAISAQIPAAKSAARPRAAAPLPTADKDDSFVEFAQGWDYVAALMQKELNHGLSILSHTNRILPEDFDVTFSVKFGIDITVKANGSIGTIQIRGGTGNDIDIDIPLRKASLTFCGMTPSDDVTYNISGSHVIMTIKLTEVESEGSVNGSNYEYQIDVKSKDAFVGVRLEDLPPEIDESEVTGLEIALLSLIQEQLSGKPYTVFSVDVSRLSDDMRCMLPVVVDYAIAEASQADDNTLAAMVMTTAARGTQSLLAQTIPSESRAAGILSNGMFLRELVMPALVKTLECDASAIECVADYDGGPSTVQLTRSFDITADDRTFTVTTLQVWIGGGNFHVDVAGETEVMAGITAHFWVKGQYSFIVTHDDDGNDVITANEEEYDSGTSVELDWWAWLLVCLLGAIEAIAAGIAYAIVNAVLPGIEDPVKNGAVSPIVWSHVGVLDIKTVDLPGSFRIAGTVPLLDGPAT